MSQTTQLLTGTYELSPDSYKVAHQLSLNLQGQSPAHRHSAEEIVKKHIENLSLAPDLKSAKQVILPTAYSPSLSSLGDLQKISFADLKLETHHRGCFITATTITHPYQSTEIITIIEETKGRVAVLKLGFQDETRQLLGQSLPLNSTVAIKEPYVQFSEESDYVIRVDHPSDIAVLRGDDPAVSMIMKFVTEKQEVSLSEWKKAGDTAYLERNYASAIECYTQAIDAGSREDPKIVRDIYRKRAYANLTFERFQNAKDDAVASCTGGAEDAKSYYAAGKAAYELREYSESKEHFKQALVASPDDPKYLNDLSQTLARLNEEQNGTYDFEEIAMSVGQDNIYLDHADFNRDVVIGETSHAGRGLFAARDIAAGSLVLCEKAFCLPDMFTTGEPNNLVLFNLNTNTRTQRPAQTSLFLKLIQKLYNNPHVASPFFALEGGSYIRSGKEGTLVDGVPVIDSFLVEAIRIKNSFSSPRRSSDVFKVNSRPSENALSTGLWLEASYINHSCLPNCSRSFIGDMMILRAITPIPKGTEITHQYMTPDASYIFRRDFYPSIWEFACTCTLCQGEKASPDPMHVKRRDLANKIKSEVLKAPSKVPGASIRSVERLTKKLEDLYEPKIYSSLPRLLLVHPTIWLTNAYRTSKSAAKQLKYALEVLRNFGFIDPIRNGKLVLDFEKGMVNSETCNAVKYAMEGYEMMGKSELAAQCEKTARRMYELLAGSTLGLEEYLSEGRVDVRKQVDDMVSAIENLGFVG